MVGTKASGAKAALTNKKKHGDDYYARIGSKGGQAGEKKEKEYVWRPGDELFSR